MSVHADIFRSLFSAPILGYIFFIHFFHSFGGNMKVFRSLLTLSLGLALVACGQHRNSHVDAPVSHDQSQDKAPLLNTDSSKAVPNQYIVVLKKSSQYLAQSTTDHLIQTLSLNPQKSKIHKVYKEVLNGFAAELSDQDLAKLRKNQNVDYIEPNTTVQLAETDRTDSEIDEFYKDSVIGRQERHQPHPPSWGLDRIDQRRLPLNKKYTYNTKATNVSIYILDTGIYQEHFDFSGRVRWGINTAGDEKNVDCHGHGTHVAGTAAGRRFGVAKGAQLVAVKVLNCKGQGTLRGVLDGIEWAAIDAKHRGRPAVANLSFISPTSRALDSSVLNAIYKYGLTIVAAAGNSRSTDACYTSPARMPEVITVASSDSDDQRSSFSSGGKCVDLFAPGKKITSAGIKDTHAKVTASGTSIAAPHVTGAIALMQAHYPKWTPIELHDAIINNSTKNVIKDAGSTPNRLLFTAP